MILEGIVTTLSPEGIPNLAPMGPKVEDKSLRRFILRPYRTSTTYRNLREHGEGVLHVTDDVLTLARAAIGTVGDACYRPADVVAGVVWLGACRYHEFRVISLDDSEARTTIVAESVASGHLRELFGLNRAKHAVVEAAILATRIDILPIHEILVEYAKLKILVEKTGGPHEHMAFHLLTSHVEAAARLQGSNIHMDVRP